MISDTPHRITWYRSERAPLTFCVATVVEASVIVMDPVTRGEEREGGEAGNDDQMDPCQSRRISHAEIGEAFLVQVQGVEEGRVDRPTRALADDEGRREGFERIDGLHDAVEEDN